MMNLPLLLSPNHLLGSEANPALLILAFVGLALVPMLMLTCTSYLKLSVVFGILKNAIGAQQVPSGAIVSMLSLVLTLHIMSPIIGEVSSLVSDELNLTSSETVSGKSASGSLENLDAKGILSLLEKAQRPISSFLRRNSGLKERLFFRATSKVSSLDNQTNSSLQVTDEEIHCEQPPDGEDEVSNEECLLEGETFLSLVPAFVISELQEGFAIGFAIFLPFLVVDIVISNLLIGLGMMMVSPVVISLPFKIILFVLCDGWFLLCRGLILGYNVGLV